MDGLDVLVVETHAPGGQAGTSSRIENYLGFPMGISGQELAANAKVQALKFGARMAVAHSVTELRCRRTPYELVLDDGSLLFARSVVIATGARYNKPAVAGIDRFAGNGSHHERWQGLAAPGRARRRIRTVRPALRCGADHATGDRPGRRATRRRGGCEIARRSRPLP